MRRARGHCMMWSNDKNAQHRPMWIYAAVTHGASWAGWRDHHTVSGHYHLTQSLLTLCVVLPRNKPSFAHRLPRG